LAKLEPLAPGVDEGERRGRHFKQTRSESRDALEALFQRSIEQPSLCTASSRCASLRGNGADSIDPDPDACDPDKEAPQPVCIGLKAA